MREGGLCLRTRLLGGVRAREQRSKDVRRGAVSLHGLWCNIRFVEKVGTDSAAIGGVRVTTYCRPHPTTATIRVTTLQRPMPDIAIEPATKPVDGLDVDVLRLVRDEPFNALVIQPRRPGNFLRRQLPFAQDALQLASNHLRFTYSCPAPTLDSSDQSANTDFPQPCGRTAEGTRG